MPSQMTETSTEATHLSNISTDEDHSIVFADNKDFKWCKTLIGKAVYIRGDVTAKEDMQVNGRIEGAISLKDHKIEIGTHANIQADVFAKIIIVNGELHGDVYASEQVVVTQTGRVFGNIFAADVCIEAGASVKGNIDMERNDISEENNNQIVVAEETSINRNVKVSFVEKILEKAHIYTHHDAQRADNAPQKKHNHSTIDLLPLSVDDKTNHHEYEFLDKSVIGELVSIKGEISAEEDVLIDGELDGVLYFKTNNLAVGQEAHLKANIFVKSISSCGKIKGDVYASEQIIIKKAGHVYGKIRSPRISIESGAVLMGSLEMEPQDIEKIFSSIAESEADEDMLDTQKIESNVTISTNTPHTPTRSSLLNQDSENERNDKYRSLLKSDD